VAFINYSDKVDGEPKRLKTKLEDGGFVAVGAYVLVSIVLFLFLTLVLYSCSK
jgi:hypothetical protein